MKLAPPRAASPARSLNYIKALRSPLWFRPSLTLQVSPMAATMRSSARPAPDGGWGWVIVVACFMAQLLAYGSPQSVGVLYPEWLNAFQQGKGMTAWVGSLVSGLGLIASPVCSACVDNFGARPVTIFSGVMVAGGLMLSAFAPNVQFLFFSYGIVVGLGCGLVYNATLTITCQYFDKRRGLALGIVTTGTSFGAFVYAALQNELLRLFGLNGCLLIVGAMSLNLMACAGFMRPLNMPGYLVKRKAALERNAQKQLLEKEFLEKELLEKHLPEKQLLEKEFLEKELLEKHLPEKQLLEKEFLEKELLEKHLPEKQLLEKQLREKELLERQLPEKQLLEKLALDDLKISPGLTAANKCAMVAKEHSITIDAKDSALVQSDDNGKKQGFLGRLAVVKVLKKKQQAYFNYTHSLANILQDRVMLAFCVAVFLFSLGAFPPVLFMEDVAQSEGLAQGPSLVPLVSIVAITTGLGKLALGMLADLKFINSIYLYTFSLFATSLALLLIPITKTYVGLQVLSAVVGFFSGNWSLTSYITTKIVGIDRLTQAHGVLLLFGGFGIAIGPPVVGWFFDWTQSYELAFYFSGSCVLLGGLILLVVALPCWDRKKRESDRPEVQYTINCDKVASVA
ncbi:unnamed protein product [Gadus morhua 'NCC']